MPVICRSENQASELKGTNRLLRAAINFATVKQLKLLFTKVLAIVKYKNTDFWS